MVDNFIIFLKKIALNGIKAVVVIFLLYFLLLLVLFPVSIIFGPDIPNAIANYKYSLAEQKVIYSIVFFFLMFKDYNITFRRIFRR